MEFSSCLKLNRSEFFHTDIPKGGRQERSLIRCLVHFPLPTIPQIDCVSLKINFKIANQAALRKTQSVIKYGKMICQVLTI